MTLFQMDHIVLNVANMEAMLHFYTEVLRLPSERLAAYRDGQVPFPSVRISADTIIDLFPRELWGKTTPGTVCRPDLNHFCLATDKAGWEALRLRLDEHSIAVAEGPVKRWGAHGTGLSIYFRDPENHYVEVRYYQNDSLDQPCLLGS